MISMALMLVSAPDCASHAGRSARTVSHALTHTLSITWPSSPYNNANDHDFISDQPWSTRAIWRQWRLANRQGRGAVDTRYILAPATLRILAGVMWAASVA
jgi:hypothetical protein